MEWDKYSFFLKKAKQRNKISQGIIFSQLNSYVT